MYLDDTLVYRTVDDDSALPKLNQLLERHRQEYGTKIVYSTGRSLVLYKEIQAQKNLLQRMPSSYL
ncbi:HAD family hydrolase [Nostoc sp.]|uniref:HAD family hydrolase n=1 Tax=Nostoc sp. TaxID=1180 RepID=UPI002FF8776D